MYCSLCLYRLGAYPVVLVAPSQMESAVELCVLCSRGLRSTRGVVAGLDIAIPSAPPASMASLEGLCGT